jgi:hypothetical protein
MSNLNNISDYKRGELTAQGKISNTRNSSAARAQHAHNARANMAHED